MPTRNELPFNVSILELTDKKLFGIRPVRRLDIFDGATGNFSDDGLFSVSIFGKVGDDARSSRFSYIDIKIPIFHPVIFRALLDLKRLYGGIMEGREFAIWNPITKDFERSNAVDGETGFHFFVQHWTEIQFSETRSDEREMNIRLIKKYKDVAMTSKIIVIPAGLRDVEIGSDGRIRRDEINDFYTSFLSVSNTITEHAVRSSPELLNNARYKLQTTFSQLYDKLEQTIKGKKGLFLGKWASRRIQNGTRNVITAMVMSNPYLGAPGSIDFNDTVVGLYQALKADLPIARYHVRNGILAELFLSPDQPVNLIDPKTLEIVPVKLSTAQYARWTTDEGIDKLITSFSEESLRHKPIMIEGHYLALIYKGPGVFKIFQNIHELPKGFDRKDVYPVTLCEFLYACTYRVLNKYPAFVTRYPITGVGSIYPSRKYVKTTVKGEKRQELGFDWQPMDESHIAYQFPITGAAFVNSFSPASNKLPGLGADFDGDTGSLNTVYSDEAVQQVNEFFNSKKAYVGTDGKFTSTIDISTVALVMHNITFPD